jgi:hypothetical protein
MGKVIEANYVRLSERRSRDNGRFYIPDNDHGIAGNCEGIQQFFNGTMRIWYRWLNLKLF